MEISREEIKELNSDYRKMLEKESHHNHKIIMDDNGTYRWEADPKVNSMIDQLNLNTLWILFYKMGLNKNSEEVRKMYRDMGYSLYGYWEIFHWEVNNPDADLYRSETSLSGAIQTLKGIGEQNVNRQDVIAMLSLVERM
jgi:hypothetical protein